MKPGHQLKDCYANLGLFNTQLPEPANFPAGFELTQSIIGDMSKTGLYLIQPQIEGVNVGCEFTRSLW